MAKRVKVVITSDRFADTGFDVENEILKRFPELEVELVGAVTPDEDTMVRVAQGAQAIITSSTDPVPRSVIERLPDLRVIGRYAVGYDNIDLDAATERGIVVTHYPAYCTAEVADHTAALILALNRRIVELDRKLHEGAWVTYGTDTRAILGTPVPPLREMTLGIIGLGRIGTAVLERMRPFGLRLLVNDPYVPDEVVTAAGAEHVSFTELLAHSDIVTLHCPLTPETRCLIGVEALARMKPTAILVNTARGPIVDLDALYVALSEGRLAGAALDVVYPEPMPVDSPLYQLPNVIVTPHAAYYSERSRDVNRIETFVEVLTALAGRKPRFVVNAAVLP